MNKLDLPYKHVLVLGLAKSGTAAAKTLLFNGKKVRVNDIQAKESDAIVVELQTLGAEVIVGAHPVHVLENIDLIVKNPGIPYENPVLVKAQEQGVPIITEIEIAGMIADGDIVGITGSNGKTTTTMLVNEMLLKSNQPVKVAGNIGIVATEVAQTLTKDETMVLELSSFQLQGIESFKPKIAVLLNIFEAHLDYHKTLKNYQEAKCNIFKNQTEEDYLVYNTEDPVINLKVVNAKSKLIPFSVNKKMENGAWIDEHSVYFKDEKIIDLSGIALVGKHNLENILAAVAAAKLSGASNEGIRQVLTTFSSVKHRLQFIGEINQRVFYNDSKATNILATQKALASFQQPVILLAGGLDRGNGFTDLLPFLTHVKAMVVFGETANKLKETAVNAGIESIVMVQNMQQAVDKAYSLSDEKDIVLLSPACASWDQYRTFEERGDMFIQAVHKINEGLV